MQSDRNHQSDQTPEEIAAIISQYRASGLGLKRFAREHGLEPGRLHYWIYQKQPGRSVKRRLQPARAVVAPIFQEIKLTTRTPPVESWAAEMNLPQGVVVRFSSTASAEWIGSVVQALQQPC
jgi:transposase-like protein